MVVAIIAILAALLLPALSSVRERAKQISCMSQLKQWGVALTTYTSENEGQYPYAENAHGTYVGTGIAPYLGGVNLTVTTRTAFWRQWITCPGKRDVGQEVLPHFYSNIALGISMVEGEYQYWGGDGDPTKADAATAGTAGWFLSYFKNGHSPTPATYGPMWPADPASRVLMCDQGIYDNSSGSMVAKVIGTGTKSGDASIRTNHGWQRMQCSGMNFLYVDGHVAWKANPWQSVSNYWNAGYGPLNW